MVINTDKLSEIYDVLKDYLTRDDISYKPTISKKYVDIVNRENFPLVTIEEIDNTLSSASFGGNESVSNLAYEINVYAIDKKYNDEIISNINICRYLVQKIDYVLSECYHMRRIQVRPTPNIDITIYRITMRYEINLFDNRGKFVR